MLAEVLGFRAAWLSQLPVGLTLACSCEQRALLITTRKQAFADAQRLRLPVLHGGHWVAMVDAAAGNRAALACLQWLSRSEWINPLTLYAALGTTSDAARENVPNCKLTVHQVLEHFGLRLVALDPPLQSLQEGF